MILAASYVWIRTLLLILGASNFRFGRKDIFGEDKVSGRKDFGKVKLSFLIFRLLFSMSTEH